MTKKTPKLTSVVSEQPVTFAAPSIPSVSEQIWNDIKNRPIEMFGLPGQTPAQYCSPVVMPGAQHLYLTYKIGSVVPAMEIAFKDRYTFDMQDRFIVVTHKALLSK